MPKIDHPIVGAWSLLAWTITYEDGREHHPFGEAPTGRILYSADGQMLASIARSDRASLSTDVPQRASSAEKAAAHDSYFSYGGRFKIDGERVIHHVDIALNPNFVGSRQVREMHFEGDTLTLSASERHRSGERRHRLRWQRMA